VGNGDPNQLKLNSGMTLWRWTFIRTFPSTKNIGLRLKVDVSRMCFSRISSAASHIGALSVFLHLNSKVIWWNIGGEVQVHFFIEKHDISLCLISFTIFISSFRSPSSPTRSIKQQLYFHPGIWRMARHNNARHSSLSAHFFWSGKSRDKTVRRSGLKIVVVSPPLCDFLTFFHPLLSLVVSANILLPNPRFALLSSFISISNIEGMVKPIFLPRQTTTRKNSLFKEET
jgi:hypothetical protein